MKCELMSANMASFLRLSMRLISTVKNHLRKPGYKIGRPGQAPIKYGSVDANNTKLPSNRYAPKRQVSLK